VCVSTSTVWEDGAGIHSILVVVVGTVAALAATTMDASIYASGSYDGGGNGCMWAPPRASDFLFSDGGYYPKIFVTSHPYARVVSPNQDPYEVPTLKHSCIIQHIHDPNKELLHKFLSYKEIHR
jgi:hypothetical protein